MLLMAVGVVLLLLKLVGVAPVSEWSWLWVLAPFGLAVLWWLWADASGYTQKKAMQRMDQRKEARRERSLEALGQSEKQRRK
ncbi:TIGR04438 family Trp-rich protein [Paucibacter sp. O1-1]|uniref:TIGR04438 family Trp-rich protein n=1 Tax=unclassified Roseateles TaxID=2626991 RepID=UPI0021D51740|nr:MULTISPECIES: TIGR04438 family Trp-rich protein [unclassified Roseateles]MCU7372550.1 TIGR04438 family Trp-rich protein [Paucibacter sp. O1-1]MCZ7882913.1 TIGR04438 family Trp-rich protein [Paucibacter sp. M5-1]MDA3827544.1 TIGR04438 family Trp-rich protein [Paucibacter sp. O1-1]MDC6169942.1 TIGR04438 family Trp-rich protein [Paucibacter sp. XJ19-41]